VLAIELRGQPVTEGRHDPIDAGRHRGVGRRAPHAERAIRARVAGRIRVELRRIGRGRLDAVREPARAGQQGERSEPGHFGGGDAGPLPSISAIASVASFSAHLYSFARLSAGNARLSFVLASFAMNARRSSQVAAFARSSDQLSTLSILEASPSRSAIAN